MQRAGSNTSKHNLSGSLRARQVHSTPKGQAKHPSPPGALLGDVSCLLSTCTKILHLTPFPPASLTLLRGDRLLHKGPCVFSSFCSTVAFLCLSLNCWRVFSCQSAWCLVEQGTKLCLGRSCSLPYSTNDLSTQCSHFPPVFVSYLRLITQRKECFSKHSYSRPVLKGPWSCGSLHLQELWKHLKQQFFQLQLKKAQVANTYVKVTDLHAWQRADWWASTLSLGELLSTSSEQNQLSASYRKMKKKDTNFLQHSFTPFSGKEGSYKWDAEVKNMFGDQ